MVRRYDSPGLAGRPVSDDPEPEPDDAEPAGPRRRAPASKDAPDPAPEDEEAEPEPETAPATSPRSTSAPRRGGGGGGLQNGSGILLGFIVWVWVVLPYLDGGRDRVAGVLRAKLTNKAADGTPLP